MKVPVKRWRRVFVAFLIVIVATILILAVNITQDSWWLYGVYVILAALLGFAAALIFDVIFPPNFRDEVAEDEEGEEYEDEDDEEVEG